MSLYCPHMVTILVLSQPTDESGAQAVPTFAPSRRVRCLIRPRTPEKIISEFGDEDGVTGCRRPAKLMTDDMSALDCFQAGNRAQGEPIEGVSVLSLYGPPSGGSYTLQVGSNTTDAISFNATAAQVQSAIAATVRGSGASVIGSAASGYTVTLPSRARLSIASSSLVGGAVAVTPADRVYAIVFRAKINNIGESADHYSVALDELEFAEAMRT